MENRIKINLGVDSTRLTVIADESFLTVSDDQRNRIPLRLSRECVFKSPFYLYEAFQAFGDPRRLMHELSEKQPSFSGLIDAFFTDLERLHDRVILFKDDVCETGSNFVCRIALSANAGEGFTIESTFEGEIVGQRSRRNALGEIQTVVASNVADASGIYEAIQEITSDDYWDTMSWGWEGICGSLKKRYPRLAEQVWEEIKQHGRENLKKVRDEQYFFRRVASYCKASEFSLALNSASEGIDAFPFSASLYALRGEVYCQVNAFDRATADLNAAIELGLESLAVYSSLGICRCIQGDFETATELFSRALALDPENIKTYLARSQAYRQLGNDLLAQRDELKADSLMRNI